MIKPHDRCRMCPFNPYYIGNINIRSSRITPEVNPIQASTKIVIYDKQFIDANLKIPVLSSDVYHQAVTQINKSIEADIMEFSKEMQEAAQLYANEAKKEGSSFIPYEISTSYKVTYNKNGIISITVIYHEYVSGINSYIKTSYNYSLITGKPLSLMDLFITGVDYKKLLNKQIVKQLKQSKWKLYPDIVQNFKGIATDQPFYVTNDGISIFLGFHQIALTEGNIPIIDIPFSELAGVLKPELLGY